MTRPTVVTVPCFSGAPWDVAALEGLAHRDVRTMRLPETADGIEGYADFLAGEVEDLREYVLVGDSFGAIIALALAVRRPAGLQGLVLSGAFASNPLATGTGRLKLAAARTLRGPLYRHLTLRFHAHSLSSPFDRSAERPMSEEDIRQLFIDNTSWSSYVDRATAAFAADYRGLLHQVSVPALILSPEHDTLIGPKAAKDLLAALPLAEEQVLRNTGHMLRFTSPSSYSGAVEDFLAKLDRVDGDRRALT